MKETYNKNTSWVGLSRAFTMLEIIIVGVVISVLTAIAVPSYSKALERFRANEGKRALYAILGAQKRYFLEYGTYSTQTANLDITIPANFEYFDPILPAGLIVGLPAGFQTVGNITRKDDIYVLYIASTGELLCVNNDAAKNYCALIGITETPGS